MERKKMRCLQHIGEQVFNTVKPFLSETQKTAEISLTPDFTLLRVCFRAAKDAHLEKIFPLQLLRAQQVFNKFFSTERATGFPLTEA